MFDSFKSAATLEKNLREWALRDKMRIMPSDELPKWSEHVNSLAIEDLIRESLSSILLTNHSVALSRAMTGAGGNDVQLRDNIRAFETVQLLCKKLSLQVSWPGEIPSQFDIKVERQ
jgi:hypothetical protein